MHDFSVYASPKLALPRLSWGLAVTGSRRGRDAHLVPLCALHFGITVQYSSATVHIWKCPGEGLVMREYNDSLTVYIWYFILLYFAVHDLQTFKRESLVTVRTAGTL